MRIFAFCFSSIVACPLTINIPQAGAGSVYDRMIAAQAEANGVPVSLIHRVIMRESRYNPRAISGGNYGLMQIRLGTARAMGYRGSAEGLLDPATNGEAKAAGCDDYVPKPFSPRQLLAKIRQYLQ
jgi:soluble lytic murein transglycosylase-like protein